MRYQPPDWSGVVPGQFCCGTDQVLLRMSGSDHRDHRDCVMDGTVRFDLFEQAGRITGYQLRYRDGADTTTGNQFVGVFYSPIGRENDRDMVVLYHDHTVRLLRFGRRLRDYLWVLRTPTQ